MQTCLDELRKEYEKIQARYYVDEIVQKLLWDELQHIAKVYPEVVQQLPYLITTQQKDVQPQKYPSYKQLCKYINYCDTNVQILKKEKTLLYSILNMLPSLFLGTKEEIAEIAKREHQRLLDAGFPDCPPNSPRDTSHDNILNHTSKTQRTSNPSKITMLHEINEMYDYGDVIDWVRIPAVNVDSSIDEVTYAWTLMKHRIKLYQTKEEKHKKQLEKNFEFIVCQCHLNKTVDDPYCDECWKTLGLHPYCDKCKAVIYKKRLFVTTTPTSQSTLFQFKDWPKDQDRLVVLCKDCYT